MIRRLIIAALVALVATLALNLPAIASTAGAIPSGTAYHDYCPAGNCLRGWVTAESYGVEVYNDTTGATTYYYGRGKAHIEHGAKRLLAYYVRLYAVTPGGTYIRLAASETNRYDTNGALSVRTPNAYTSSAPCDLRVKFGLGIRWSDGSFGKRGGWSDIFNNYDNPNCA